MRTCALLIIITIEIFSFLTQQNAAIQITPDAILLFRRNVQRFSICREKMQTYTNCLVSYAGR